ncbi:MAG: hypothetical protein R3Y11_03345 [Pseudomonadota bacterium]
MDPTMLKTASIATNTIATSTVEGSSGVSNATQARFNEAMQTAQEQSNQNINAPQHVHNEAEVAMQRTPPVQKTAGDTVLDAMHKEFKESRTAFEHSVNSMEGSTGDLMRLQYQIAQVTMSQTMIGQVGSKVSQGTQQLLKGQS